jgi:hypothetical protein
VHEFPDEVAVLSQWLGRDIAADPGGVLPAWNAFRFRDAMVFVADAAERAARMYLVRGTTVREFAISETTIDEAYVRLSEPGLLPAVA